VALLFMNAPVRARRSARSLSLWLSARRFVGGGLFVAR
jgi:hypothetical protein